MPFLSFKICITLYYIHTSQIWCLVSQKEREETYDMMNYFLPRIMVAILSLCDMLRPSVGKGEEKKGQVSHISLIY